MASSQEHRPQQTFKIMHKESMSQENKTLKSIPVVSMHALAQLSPGWTLRLLLLGQLPKNPE